MATLRALGKGAPLWAMASVDCFEDDRSDQLDDLLRIYDGRDHGFDASGTGTFFHRSAGEKANGMIFLPSSMLVTFRGATFGPGFLHLGMDVSCVPSAAVDYPNFFWAPFALLNYHEAHKPFALIIIAECNSKRRHTGLERGSTAVIQGRKNFLKDLLSQVDEEAIWLAHHARGELRHSRFKWIFGTPLPSPGVELNARKQCLLDWADGCCVIVAVEQGILVLAIQCPISPVHPPVLSNICNKIAEPLTL